MRSHGKPKCGSPRRLRTSSISTENASLDHTNSGLAQWPANRSYLAFIEAVEALAMGSVTYEWILRHADEVAAQTGTTWPYSQPTWVFSRRTLPRVAGADIRFVRGYVRPIHAAMRDTAGSKNIWIVGGGDLAGQFYDAGLLDEMVVHVGSVTLGRDKQLFPRRVTSPPLRLVSVRQVGSGLAELRYEVPTVAGTAAA
ncbi:MAG: deaminase [Candidatus Dadabacteria bacterium]